MQNQFDFYTVQLISNRKTDIYNALGGKTAQLQKDIKGQKSGFRSGYPVIEYRLNVGYADVATAGAEAASAKAEAIADKFRGLNGVRVYTKYCARD